MQFDLKSAELPLAGYTLVLRGPTLHQHQAVLKTLAELDGYWNEAKREGR